MLFSLAISIPLNRALAGSLPFGDGWLCFAGLSPMVCEDLWMRFLDDRKLFVNDAGDGEMQLLAPALKQRFITGIADQSVLKHIGRIWRHATHIQEFGVGQIAQEVLKAVF